jgi:hypothetical protein
MRLHRTPCYSREDVSSKLDSLVVVILGLHPLHDDGRLLDEWYFSSLPGSINKLDFQEIQS